jgi:hypothetical protein
MINEYRVGKALEGGSYYLFEGLLFKGLMKIGAILKAKSQY